MTRISRLIIKISRLIDAFPEAFPEAESVSFSGSGFLFWWSTNRIQFLFNEGLFLKIKESRILLDQEDQLLIGLIKILQEFNGQDHLIVQLELYYKIL